MSIQKSEIKLDVNGQPVNAYLTSPKDGGRSVLVLHAWWGLKPFFKELCDRLRVRPGDLVEFLEHNGRITILKKTRGASAGVLRHLKADTRFSDEESMRDALARRRAKVAAKRRAA